MNGIGWAVKEMQNGQRARRAGWKEPAKEPRTEDWFGAWVRYWADMQEYERQIAAGNPDPGRPVVPHRSGGGER